MSAAPWIKPVRNAVWAATVALAAMSVADTAAWAQAAAAEEDDIEDHILNADKRMFNAILAPFGLGSASAPDITYRERSPLVVPKGRDLPPPGKAAKNGDWPIEPEVKAKRAAAALRKSGRDPAVVDPAKPISGTAENYKTGYTGTWADAPKGQKEPDFLTMLMQGKLSGSWEEVGKFDGEPPRTTLVDPPPGYLTPSPAAPYGVTPRQEGPVKKEKPL
jgi:hypothetical protein